MLDPTTTAALTTAIDNSTKVANTPLFSTVIDRLLGFKISEWKAQGDVIKKQITDGYEEAKKKGLGFQYASTFRESTNLINIGAKATEHIDDSKPNNILLGNDFFWGIINHAKEVSNEDMQELIAKILAGEYNSPGTYSMSTLQILKSLGKSDLEKLSLLGVAYLPAHGFLRDFFSMDKDALNVGQEIGLDYGDFLEMQNLGLIQSGSYTVSITLQKDKQ
jgi:hypothetical protein